MPTLDPIGRTEELLRNAESSVQRKFIDLIKHLVGKFTPAELADMINRNDFRDLEEEINNGSLALSLEMIAIAYVASGVDTASFLSSKLDVSAVYDNLDRQTVTAMQRYSNNFTTGFYFEQVDGVRQTISDGRLARLPDAAIAERVQVNMGLSESQRLTVERFRNALESGSSVALQRELRDKRFDPTIRRLIGGEVVPQEKIDQMVKRYAENLIRYRAKTVARTETLTLVNEGIEDMYRQAASSGILDLNKIVKVWHNRGGNVRHSHSTMNGQERIGQEPFISGNGNTLRYPGDRQAPIEDVANCKCMVSRSI